MHSYVYQVSLQPVQSETYAKAGHLPDWFYEQVCSYAENADPAWREQAIQELLQFLGPLCTRTGSRLTFNPSLRDGFFRRGYVCFKAAAEVLARLFGVQRQRDCAGLRPGAGRSERQLRGPLQHLHLPCPDRNFGAFGPMAPVCRSEQTGLHRRGSKLLPLSILAFL